MLIPPFLYLIAFCHFYILIIPRLSYCCNCWILYYSRFYLWNKSKLYKFFYKKY